MPLKRQSFDLICVLDFEATCDTEGRMRRMDMEIIEFPSVLIDSSTMEVVDEFQRFVTPLKYGVSPFCTELTGITQQTIDENGRPFLEVLQEHQEWLRSHTGSTKSVIVLTCGDWDLKTMLPIQVG